MIPVSVLPAAGLLVAFGRIAKDYTEPTANPQITAINTGVFGGILIGAVTAFLYNRYHKVRLPQILGFFSGRRLISIITAASAIIIGLVLGLVWGVVHPSKKVFAHLALTL